MIGNSTLRGVVLVLAATAGFASLGTLAGLAYQAGMNSSTFACFTPTAFLMLGEPRGGILLAAIVLRQPLTVLEGAGGALIVLPASSSSVRLRVA